MAVGYFALTAHLELRGEGMSNYIGLYYPTIGFKSDAWVKLAALYWDKLARIVPIDQLVNDSKTVRQLADELNFIENFAPSEQDLRIVGEMFLTAMHRNLEELGNLYNISVSDYSTRPFEQVGYTIYQNIGGIVITSEELSQFENMKNKLNPKLSYILAEGKMFRPLSEAFVNAGLGDYIEGDGDFPSFIGLNPRLAIIYMEVLAAQLASNRQLYPVTDNVLDHVASSGYSVERLARVLLLDDLKSSPTSKDKIRLKQLAKSLIKTNILSSTDEIEVQIATIALQSVLPKDIDNVPTSRIIKLRKKHRDEMTAFQVYIHDFASKLLLLQDISDPKALKAHLQVEYEKGLKPQLEDLQKCLKSLGIDTVMGAMNVRVAIPALLAGAGSLFHLLPLSPLIIGAGAIAFSTFPVIQKKQQEAKQILKSSPAAYLLYTQEGLEPHNLVSEVSQQARQFLFRV